MIRVKSVNSQREKAITPLVLEQLRLLADWQLRELGYDPASVTQACLQRDDTTLSTAALEAKGLYIREMFAAQLYGDDVDREAEEWLRRLTELVSPFADVPAVADWYAAEETRLLKLTA